MNKINNEKFINIRVSKRELGLLQMIHHGVVHALVMIPLNMIILVRMQSVVYTKS